MNIFVHCQEAFRAMPCIENARAYIRAALEYRGDDKIDLISYNAALDEVRDWCDATIPRLQAILDRQQPN